VAAPMEGEMETLLGMGVGIGLSAACGFRVFVPLLVMNLASLAGLLDLAPAFRGLGVPTQRLPSNGDDPRGLGVLHSWVDHLLDLFATPAAIIAGTVATASVVTDLSPFLKWTMALIAGGGIAGLVQGTSVLLRATSSAATAGIGNPVVSTLELLGSVITALLAILVRLSASLSSFFSVCS